jgi:hypothetical protein
VSALAAGLTAALALALVALAIVRGAARSRRQREHGERRRWHAERLADLRDIYAGDLRRWRGGQTMPGYPHDKDISDKEEQQ